MSEQNEPIVKRLCSRWPPSYSIPTLAHIGRLCQESRLPNPPSQSLIGQMIATHLVFRSASPRSLNCRTPCKTMRSDIELMTLRYSHCCCKLSIQNRCKKQLNTTLIAPANNADVRSGAVWAPEDGLRSLSDDEPTQPLLTHHVPRLLTSVHSAEDPPKLTRQIRSSVHCITFLHFAAPY